MTAQVSGCLPPTRHTWAAFLAPQLWPHPGTQCCRNLGNESVDRRCLLTLLSLSLALALLSASFLAAIQGASPNRTQQVLAAITTVFVAKFPSHSMTLAVADQSSWPPPCHWVPAKHGHRRKCLEHHLPSMPCPPLYPRPCLPVLASCLQVYPQGAGGQH